MTAPRDYNAARLASGAITPEHVTELVRYWQSGHGLAVDGMAGPRTIASLAAFRLAMPLPTLPDGRHPVITSGFKTANPSRPNHDGVDLFYEWRRGDKPDRVVDSGAAGRNPDGTPRWGVPDGTCAIAAAAGVIQLAGNSPTGYRCWIDHGAGLRTGYFHLRDIRVLVGQRVEVGHPIGLVGDNPIDKGDARHLHFEVSPVDRYEPMDPEPLLRV